MTRAAILCLLLPALLGCAPLPGAESAAVAQAPYPALEPIDRILAEAEGGAITPATTAGIEARAAALRARAQGLRGPVIGED